MTMTPIPPDTKDYHVMQDGAEEKRQSHLKHDPPDFSNDRGGVSASCLGLVGQANRPRGSPAFRSSIFTVRLLQQSTTCGAFI